MCVCVRERERERERKEGRKGYKDGERKKGEAEDHVHVKVRDE